VVIINEARLLIAINRPLCFGFWFIRKKVIYICVGYLTILINFNKLKG